MLCPSVCSLINSFVRSKRRRRDATLELYRAVRVHLAELDMTHDDRRMIDDARTISSELTANWKKARCKRANWQMWGEGSPLIGLVFGCVSRVRVSESWACALVARTLSTVAMVGGVESPSHVCSSSIQLTDLSTLQRKALREHEEILGRLGDREVRLYKSGTDALHRPQIRSIDYRKLLWKPAPCRIIEKFHTERYCYIQDYRRKTV